MIFELLYQKIIKWYHRKETCDHNWVYTGYNFTQWGSGYYRKMKKYKCSKCNKKEKRLDKDAGDFIMI